jgi:hypothetical protein
MKQAAYSTQSLKKVMQLQLFAVVGLNLKKSANFGFPYYFLVVYFSTSPFLTTFGYNF